jgi:hypothetical protein
MLKMTWTKNAEGRVVGVWMTANKSENANGAVATILRADRFPNASASRGEMPVALAA